MSLCRIAFAQAPSGAVGPVLYNSLARVSGTGVQTYYDLSLLA